ncbi:MAG: PilT/PilU family type 4a pilus ATPase [Gammaproteobacteria bacterium]
MNIIPYLKLMVEKEASDLFFTVDAPVKIKLNGQVTSVGKTRLSGELVKQAAYGIMSAQQIAHFEETLEADFAIALEDGSARFRVNVFRQRGEVAMVLRLIPARIPTLAELGLPEVLKSLVLNKRGLTLMAGATGSGKSTTLAAMIEHRNENVAGHILTIEDPIEFYHPNRKSIVNQREVGIDTLSYAHALRSALREAPDVILIGEIRDRESMEAAVQLANTGHLAIATLHANNASEALERIINLFPEELHKQLFMDLAINLKAIISQRLVQDVNGKRCAATEVLINTPHIAELILKRELGAIKEAMANSGAEGMQTFDMALYKLFQQGRVTLEEALGNADSRTNLEAKVNFG